MSINNCPYKFAVFDGKIKMRSKKHSRVDMQKINVSETLQSIFSHTPPRP
jgi:hypothetical protein